MPFSTSFSASFSVFSVFAVGTVRQVSGESVDSCSFSSASALLQSHL